MSELRPIPGLGPGFYESGPEQPDDTTLTPKQLAEMAHQAVLWLRLCDLIADGKTRIEVEAPIVVADTGARQCRVTLSVAFVRRTSFVAPSLGECLLQATAWKEANK